MSIKEMTMYAVVCDLCAASFDEEETVAWTDPQSAEAIAEMDYEWTVRDGKHYCSKHWICEKCGSDAGDLAGERDYLCPACFAKESA